MTHNPNALYEHPDFIFAKRHRNSVQYLRERYPDGCPDHVSAAALNMTEEEFQAEYKKVVEKLRTLMGVELG